MSWWSRWSHRVEMEGLLAVYIYAWSMRKAWWYAWHLRSRRSDRWKNLLRQRLWRDWNPLWLFRLTLRLRVRIVKSWNLRYFWFLLSESWKLSHSTTIVPLNKVSRVAKVRDRVELHDIIVKDPVVWKGLKNRRRASRTRAEVLGVHGRDILLIKCWIIHVHWGPKAWLYTFFVDPERLHIFIRVHNFL